MNGEIFIWNTNFDEAKAESVQNKLLLTKSQPDEYFHREPILELLWVPLHSIEASEREVVLLSLATDGKVLMWD